MAKSIKSDTRFNAEAIAEHNKLKSSSLKDLHSKLMKAAANKSAANQERELMSLAFWHGRQLQKTGKPFEKGLFNDEFDAYAKAHWSAADMPGDDSLKQYRSRYGAFCEAGLITWSDDIVDKVIAIKGLNLAKRASLVRELTQEKGKPLAAAPNVKVVDAALFPVEDEDEAPEATTAIKSLINVGVNCANNPNVIELLRTTPKLAAVLRPVLETLVEERAARAAELTNKTTKADQLAAVAEARKALAKVKATRKLDS